MLLLLIVGTLDRRLVATFKRLNLFAKEDFDLLVAIVAKFRQLFVTPHILTEVSNLAGGLPLQTRNACFHLFASSIAAAEEIATPSAKIATTPWFIRFGITDAGIVEAAAAPRLIITVDFPLAQYLASRDLPVINFNHIRYLAWT